jgi:membrane protein YdbS with pleckstrin-like domain
MSTPVSATKPSTGNASASATDPSVAVVRTAEGEPVLYQTRERLGIWWWITFLLVIGLLTLPWWAARTTTVTPQRVIKRAGLVFRQSQAIPLTKIADVNTVFGPLAAAVYLTSAGGPGMTIGPLTHRSARQFVATVEAAREAVS